MDEYAREKKKEQSLRGHTTRPYAPITNFKSLSDEIMALRKRVFGNENIVLENMAYNRRYFSMETIPKKILHAYAGSKKMTLPVYETKKDGRLFYTVLLFDGKKYASMLWEREVRYAEQAAALVCIMHLGLIDEEYLMAIGLLYR